MARGRPGKLAAIYTDDRKLRCRIREQPTWAGSTPKSDYYDAGQRSADDPQYRDPDTCAVPALLVAAKHADLPRYHFDCACNDPPGSTHTPINGLTTDLPRQTLIWID